MHFVCAHRRSQEARQESFSTLLTEHPREDNTTLLGQPHCEHNHVISKELFHLLILKHQVPSSRWKERRETHDATTQACPKAASSFCQRPCFIAGLPGCRCLGRTAKFCGQAHKRRQLVERPLHFKIKLLQAAVY